MQTYIKNMLYVDIANELLQFPKIVKIRLEISTTYSVEVASFVGSSPVNGRKGLGESWRCVLYFLALFL